MRFRVLTLGVLWLALATMSKGETSALYSRVEWSVGLGALSFATISDSPTLTKQTLISRTESSVFLLAGESPLGSSVPLDPQQ